MTQPPPAFDPGNPLLGQVQSRLDTAMMSANGQNMGIATFRTASTTLTVLLTAAELRDWAALFAGLADKMDGGGGGLATATMADVVALGRQQR